MKPLPLWLQAAREAGLARQAKPALGIVARDYALVALESLRKPQPVGLDRLKAYKPQPLTLEKYHVVNETKGTFLSRGGKTPERCEHGCVIGNWCSGCQPMHKDVPIIGWSPRSLTEPTVDSFANQTVARVIKDKKDKPWHGTPARPWTPTGSLPPSSASKGKVWKSDVMTDIQLSKPEVVLPYQGEVTIVPTFLPEVEDKTVELAKSDAEQIKNAFKGFAPLHVNSDGKILNSLGVVTSEVEKSVTMEVPSVDEVKEHVVLYPDGRAKSYIERQTTEHYKPEMLELLPHDFTNESLGIRNNIDALVLYVIAQAITEFEMLYGDERNDERVVASIRRRAKTYQTVLSGSFTSDAVERTVRMRLRNVTVHQVRELRERLEAQRGVTPVASSA